MIIFTTWHDHNHHNPNWVNHRVIIMMILMEEIMACRGGSHTAFLQQSSFGLILMYNTHTVFGVNNINHDYWKTMRLVFEWCVLIIIIILTVSISDFACMTFTFTRDKFFGCFHRFLNRIVISSCWSNYPFNQIIISIKLLFWSNYHFDQIIILIKLSFW